MPATTSGMPSRLIIPGRAPVPVFDAAQTEELEAAIRAGIATLNDPLERSQALERLALTKLRAADFDACHQELQAAADAAFESSPSLRRDLRLIELISVLLDTAASQIIEGLSNNPMTMNLTLSSGYDTPEVAPSPSQQSVRLDQARQEWQLGYRLAKSIRVEDYRSEQLARVAIGEAAGSNSISRAGFRGTLLPQTFELPREDLLTFADELLVEAGTEASKIDRVVWRNQAMIEVAIIAAESLQVARARAIATNIADPASRSQALVRTGENLITLAARVESEVPRFLQDAWDRYRNIVAMARSELQADLDLERLSSIEEAAYVLNRKRESLEALDQAAVNLDQRVQLLNQLIHNAHVARSTIYQGPDAEVPIRRSAAMEAQLERVVPRTKALRQEARALLETAREQVDSHLEAARTAGSRTLSADQDPFLEIARQLPAEDDPLWTEMPAQLTELAATSGELAHQAIVPEATEVYQAAARAVAAIDSGDPRSDSADILIASLISVNRFDDARASVSLLSNASRQILALCEIAEAQGRRGLANSAYAWIERDVPSQYRDILYRHVEAGVLTTVDENRLRRSLIAPIR